MKPHPIRPLVSCVSRRAADDGRAEPACAVHAGHRRDAGEARSGQLADVATHARQLGLQPARSGESLERESAADGLVARDGTGQRAGSDAARLQRRDVRAESQRLHLPPSRRAPAGCCGSTGASCPPISGSTCRSSRSTATWRSTARRSSTRAPTTSSSRSTRRPASSRGRRRSSTTARARNRARGRSSPRARSSPAAAASRKAVRTRA